MSRDSVVKLVILTLLFWQCQTSVAQTVRSSVGFEYPNDSIRPASLPTDRSLRIEGGLPLQELVHPGSESLEGDEHWQTSESQPRLKSKIRPRFDASAEWVSRVDGIAVSSYDLSIQQPLYPVFGPPPPFINAGYSLTRLDAPSVLDIPENLHEISFGLAWMRPIKEKWMARLMLNGAFASDLNNNGRDAWQIRGGVFLVYRRNDQWSYAIGAIATGRADIPVFPAVGTIWQPSRRLKVNLMMPKPQISVLLSESGNRQHWGYLGGGISGGTWAYERANGINDQLSYRAWRLVLGWESMLAQPHGTFRSGGIRWNTEVGFAFGRRFEFESDATSISIGDALLFQSGLSF